MCWTLSSPLKQLQIQCEQKQLEMHSPLEQCLLCLSFLSLQISLNAFSNNLCIENTSHFNSPLYTCILCTMLSLSTRKGKSTRGMNSSLRGWKEDHYTKRGRNSTRNERSISVREECHKKSKEHFIMGETPQEMGGTLLH